MVLPTLSINSFWVDRSLARFFNNLGLNEVIGGRESKKLVCNSYLLRL